MLYVLIEMTTQVHFSKIESWGLLQLIMVEHTFILKIRGVVGGGTIGEKISKLKYIFDFDIPHDV
eukprot:snap_masked-scaffold_13-processed-gene-7.6-mRNA-1 protein AED:1.00 eAED:1.00 QI:0/0/0/0/1/1/2/0/64